MRTLLLAACLFAAATFTTAPRAEASDPPYAGLDLQAEADAADLGLPLYPGARRAARQGDKASANLGLWGGSLGFRLTLLSLESDDPVDRVAAFYRDALARHGPVLDCSGQGRPVDKGCGDDRAPPGGHQYRVQVDGDTRVVAIKPEDGTTQIQLVRVAVGRAAAGR